MGDNRNNSMDSRNKIIGLVDIEDELWKSVFSISTKKVYRNIPKNYVINFI